MEKTNIPDEMRVAARDAWHRYLDILVPFRPELHRYCRKLTGNIWDAEDLVQDTLLKGFGTLGSVHAPIDNPRGYLVRIATNLWIDACRRRDVEHEAASQPQPEPPRELPGASDVRRAGQILFEKLAPQERAALVLKDVFDMTLAEIAGTLSTSVAAVKAALHRGRERIQDVARPPRRAASPELVAKFVERLDASDLDGLLALMLDTGSIEMKGALVEVGRTQFERKGSWLWQAVHVHPDLPSDMRPPKWLNQLVLFRGEPIVLGFMPLPDGRLLQGITRFEEEDGKVARIHSYCFSPETAAEVAAELGVKTGWIPYRFPSFAPQMQS